jgi:hypothetical protein
MVRLGAVACGSGPRAKPMSSCQAWPGGGHGGPLAVSGPEALDWIAPWWDVAPMLDCRLTLKISGGKKRYALKTYL